LFQSVASIFVKAGTFWGYRVSIYHEVLKKCYRFGILLFAEQAWILRGKVKPVPLHVWTGPEGSRWLRLPDFKTVGT
jgi:hypothetical protein